MTVWPTVEAASMNYCLQTSDEKSAFRAEVDRQVDLRAAMCDLRFRAGLIQHNAKMSVITLNGDEPDAFKIGYARQGYIQALNDVDCILKALDTLNRVHGF